MALFHGEPDVQSPVKIQLVLKILLIPLILVVNQILIRIQFHSLYSLSDFPGVYTRVTDYLDWIENTKGQL